MVNNLSVIKGSDREFLLKITMKDTGDTFDLSSVSQIKVYFLKEDGSVLEKNMTPQAAVTIADACQGKIKVVLSELETATLSPGEAQSFEVEIQVGDVTTIVQFREVLNVIDRLFGG